MKKIIQWLCGFCLLAGLLCGCRTTLIQDQLETYASSDPALFSDEGIDAQAYRLGAETEHRMQSKICAIPRVLRSPSGLNRKPILNGQPCFRWDGMTGM